MKRESTGRENHNWGTYQGCRGNLKPSKLPGMYESDPNEDN